MDITRVSYLKEFLEGRGHRAFAVGQDFRSVTTSRRIKQSRLVICMSETIGKAVKKNFDLERLKLSVWMLKRFLSHPVQNH